METKDKSLAKNLKLGELKRALYSTIGLIGLVVGALSISLVE